MVWFKPYFQIFCFEILVLRGPHFQKWQKGSSYSGEVKLILVMYMVQVYKKSVFLEVYVSILFFLGGGEWVFTMEVASLNSYN